MGSLENCYLLIDELIGGGFFPLANIFSVQLLAQKAKTFEKKW